MLENIQHAITRLTMDRLCCDATWMVISHRVLDMSAMLRLPWQRPTNGALNILQLWASGGRTREPILLKFGLQQQIRTSVT